jgi:microcystin-dependent protein
MGLHPAQGTGSYSHTDGTGIRLDKFNWWFTNNQFRVGSVDSYIKWTTDPTPLLDVVGQIRATSGYIGGTNSGWEINEGIIKSSVETNTIILDAGISTGNPFISIGDENNPSFYADSEGSLNIGSGAKSLTYNPIDGVTVEGTIKAKSGFIGPDAATGWQFGSDGRLQSGQGDNTVVLVSAGANFGGGSSTVKINRVLVDDEYPENLELLGTIYMIVDLANVNSSYLSLDPEVSQGFWDKYINFSFTNNTPGTISALLDGKRLIVQSVTNTSPFMAQVEAFDPNDLPITTVSASEQIDPSYIERSGTTLVFYTTEKLAGFTGYNSSFDLAAGQVVTIVADSEVASISSLNDTTATISSIDTLPTYDAEDDTNYYKITMTATSSATLLRSSDFFSLNFYRVLPSTQRALVVYPEDLSLNVNSPNLQGHTSYTSVSTAATGTIGAKTVTVSSNSGIVNRMSVIGTGIDPYSKVAGTPPSTVVDLSKSNTSNVNSIITFASASITFYDSFAPGGTVNYYMWAGDQDPVSSSFSIVQNTSNSKIVVKADAGTTPVGSINMWATQTLPEGWILCNGSAITYAQYPELYVVLGGVSPFTATINLPDMRGRFPLGASSGTMPLGRLSKALGSTPLDTFTHNHTTSIAHNHGHNIATNAHNHSDNFATSNHNHTDNIDSTGGAASSSTGSGSTFLFSGVAGTYRYHTHSVTANVTSNNITNQGGGLTGNVTANNLTNQGGTINGGVTGQAATATSTAPQTEILPPYFPIHYIIYTGVVT